MAKLSFMLAVLFAAFTVGEFAGILRKQFLQEPVNVKGEADPGEPLFLTPYIKKKDYRTGIFRRLWDFLSRAASFQMLTYL